eukprot:scaffold16623_cov93-Isochrysis_galbana.AAC.2
MRCCKAKGESPAVVGSYEEWSCMSSAPKKSCRSMPIPACGGEGEGGWACGLARREGSRRCGWMHQGRSERESPPGEGEGGARWWWEVAARRACHLIRLLRAELGEEVARERFSRLIVPRQA